MPTMNLKRFNRYPIVVAAAVVSFSAGAFPLSARAQDTGITATNDAIASYNAGIDAFKKNDLPGAMAAMEKAVSADPKNAEAQAWYGYLLLRQNNAAEAIPHLETAVSLKSTADACTNLGNALLSKPERTQEDTLRAREMFRKAAALTPKSSEAQFNIGIASGRSGDYPAAAAAYRQAVALNPKDARAWTNLGDAYLKMQKDSEAASALEKAVELSPQDGALQANLGAIQYRRGNVVGAIQHLEASRALDGLNYGALTLLARAYAQTGKNREAGNAYGAAADLQESGAPSAPKVADPSTRYNQGVVLARAGRLSEALAAYDKALTLNPHYVDALLNAGAIQFQQGRTDAAITRFQSALEIQPGSVIAQSNLAAAYTKKGEMDKAAPLWQKVVAASPKDYTSRENLADLLMSRNKPAEALPLYKQMARLNPKAAAPQIGLGLAYQKLDNLDAAYAAFTRAIRLDPRSATAYNDLGVLYEKRGQLTEAMAAYKKALALNPSMPDARVNLARFAIK